MDTLINTLCNNRNNHNTRSIIHIILSIHNINNINNINKYSTHGIPNIHSTLNMHTMLRRRYHQLLPPLDQAQRWSQNRQNPLLNRRRLRAKHWCQPWAATARGLTDIATGKEVDCNDIEHSMFVLTVDLWAEDALKEVNLVRHTSATPSISSTTTASFEQMENASGYLESTQPESRTGYGPGIYGQSNTSPRGRYSPASAQFMQHSSGYGPPGPYGDYRSSDYGMHNPSQMPGYGPPRVFNGPVDMMTHRFVQGNQPQGMFTRNLIGSLAASAFRLQDADDRIGICLRFSFVNVAPPSVPPGGRPSGQLVNNGRAPALATCFSEVFTVHSAKKFPGVCESTLLSKTFATQGIKIPIRKEGAGKGSRDDDDDDYD
ncbi:hypothetical protein SEPCBS119000_004189 [Sporothrix epigloea]|uniref:Velvet domain-containing protein n=1 Tax=Sporothrix epigloea TaxID=1892477 RepID=A0ABP0DQQ6_9PEZI